MRKNKKLLVIAATVMATLFQLLIWRPLFVWLKSFLPWLPYAPYLVITLILSISLPLSFTVRNRKASAVFHFIGEALFVPVMILAPMLLVAQISALFVSEYPVRTVGNIIAAVFLLICAAGIINAFFIREKHYEVRFNKPCDNFRIALISDIHLGAFSDRHMMQRIVRAVSRTKPDIVLIAGDFFDDRFEAIRHPEKAAATLKQLSDSIPVYCAEGNHDLLDSAADRSAFLEKAGIEWMEDAVISYRGCRILFRRDASDTKRKTMQELSTEIRTEGPLIAVAHNPSDIKELWNYGCDLTLSGHTHGGQTFPGNLLYQLLPVHSYGRRISDGKTAIVTSGIGFYGLPVRFLVNSEVAVIDVISTQN